MPSWLQVFVNINPVTHAVTAVRGLMHGTVTADQIVAVLIGCAVLIGIFGPITMYLYRNKNAR
jgi:ABC-2 type transport system permease protein